ncbi:DUF1572 family protein [Cochleicola gelatinilyticus]|uniref:DUF1572 family protein n=1 Tax=Cochleicola gelatinilyticus TaxID=1763537 RepID=UPI0008389BD5|nr:DUF1572 family protein [Cochleicola gelatinilyticus]
METNYLESVTKQFAYYKLLGDKTIDQLEDEHLFYQFHIETNSIAIIVNHLWGNMRSRWTNFLTTDGEKTWRNRDLEFESVLKSRQDILQKWEAGWECLFTALKLISSEKLNTIIYIRNQGHTVIEAINRQLAHYSYHVGQMVCIGKILKGKSWESLSIPKGNSNIYNRNKFSEEKKITHFTNEYLIKQKTMNTDEKMTRIYTGSPILAEALVGRLKSVDIIPIVKDDQQSGIMFGNAPNLTSQVRVFIRNDEMTQAQPMIEAFFKETGEEK